MKLKNLWKAILLFLGLFFLLHAFGALQVISMDIVGVLFGFHGTTTQGLASELVPQMQFLMYLLCALILIAAFIKFILPKKVGAVDSALHHPTVGTLHTWITCLYCYIFAILAIESAAFAVQGMLHIDPPPRLNAAFMFLAIMCFDNAFGIIEKLMAAKRKHDQAKNASA